MDAFKGLSIVRAWAIGKLLRVVFTALFVCKMIRCVGLRRIC
jgi:hypothetical protein